MRILVVEDEPVLADQVRRAQIQEGRVVDVTGDGDEAAFLGATEPYDLVVLDLGLPQRDGLSILRDWRQQGIEMPVIILTARDAWSQRVDALDAGADDYLGKPFHMAELSARIRALLRRGMGRTGILFDHPNFCFDTRTQTTTVNGQIVELTAQEVSVLAYLVRSEGRLVSTTELSEHIYAYDGDRDSNTIAVFITRLRRKLGAEAIKTVRGRGYVIDRS